LIKHAFLNYSPLESDRFGLNIYRGATDHLDIEAIKTSILQNLIDVAIFRLPAEKTNTLHFLGKLGFPYIVADTLVYYSTDLEQYNTTDFRNKDLVFCPVGALEQDILKSLVDIIFKNYTNHYASNPYFEENAIRAGYKEWVLGYINAKEKLVWFVKRGAEIIGFAACSFDTVKSEFEGVLYGVLPSHSGGGVYTDIIKFTKNFAKEEGFKTMLVSTQIQNYAVQKVWGREGFSIKNAYTTIHINAMLCVKSKNI
jgi:GNAT superfamily N-acetyltransferase